MTDPSGPPLGRWSDEAIQAVFVPRGAAPSRDAEAPDRIGIPAVFVPHGQPIPPEYLGPDWIRVPVQFPSARKPQTQGA
jgi:hypothetical protein